MGTTRHKPRLLKSCQVPAAAFGQGGCRDCHLLEAEESPVGAESCCQCCDPCTADGIALETETNREGVRMGQSWHHRWAAGSCLGWKVLISPRKRHLPTTGNGGAKAGGPTLEDPGWDQPLLLTMAAPAPAGRRDKVCQPCPHLPVTMAAGLAGSVTPMGLGSLSQGQDQGTATHHQEPSALLSRCCSHGE